MQAAIALVQPGQTLALGGMTLYRRPVGFVHHLLQQQPPPHELTLLAFTASYAADLLVGAGVVSTIRTCYFGFEAFGLAPMFTTYAQQTKVTIIEETEASLAMGIRATMAGVGFMPSRAWLGTDLPTLRPDVKTITDPYSGERLMAFPAIRCDVAVIHALEADRYGNARLNKNYGIDKELPLICDTLIITAEEINPGKCTSIDIPATLTTAVVHAPYGAWPTSCHPRYPVAGGELLRYLEACHAGEFDAYLQSFEQPLTE
jgi:glutaconate CoA-transferase, subunit A